MSVDNLCDIVNNSENLLDEENGKQKLVPLTTLKRYPIDQISEKCCVKAENEFEEEKDLLSYLNENENNFYYSDCLIECEDQFQIKCQANEEILDLFKYSESEKKNPYCCGFYENSSSIVRSFFYHQNKDRVILSSSQTENNQIIEIKDDFQIDKFDHDSKKRKRYSDENILNNISSKSKFHQTDEQ